MNEHAQAAADLEASAVYIEKHGWCQNALTDQDGAVCAMGAVYSVVDLSRAWVTDIVSDEVAERCEFALRALGCAVRDIRYGDIPGWNDTKGRTADEVIDAFRKAAKNEANLS